MRDLKKRMGRNEKHCEDCGKATEYHYMSRCICCQKKWEKKQEEKINKIFPSKPEEKKPNKHQIKHLYFDNGFSIESIYNLTGVPEEKIKGILGIDKIG